VFKTIRLPKSRIRYIPVIRAHIQHRIRFRKISTKPYFRSLFLELIAYDRDHLAVKVHKALDSRMVSS
jgi:hypothetical protein